MPGIFFIWSGKGTPDENRIKALLSYRNDVNFHVVLSSDKWVIGYSNHTYYPVEVVKKGRGVVLREGVKYFDDEGEFIEYELSDEELNIRADHLGRLPLYLYRGKDELAVMREPKVLLSFMKPSLNRVALLEYIVFGYPLGERTLIEGLIRVPPFTGLSINLKNGTFTIEKKEVNLEEMEEENGDIEGLKDALVEATRIRLGDSNYLLLSAGMDSRLVGAAMKKSAKEFEAIFFKVGERYKEEEEIVRRVAETLKVPLKVFDLKEDLNTIKALSVLKDGLNTAGAFMLDLFKYHREKGIYHTGDGGDKVLPDLRPPLRINNPERLVKYVLEENALIEPEFALKLTGTSCDFSTHLLDHLSRYPEADFRYKYAHFLLMERGFRWLFEGEDRNRFFVWSTTPFYDGFFFRRAMSIRQEKKKNYRLFIEILKKLDSRLLEIPYVKIGSSLTSLKGRLYFILRDIVLSQPGFIKKMIKSKKKPVPRFRFKKYLGDVGEIFDGGAGKYIDLELIKRSIEELPEPAGELLLYLLYYLNYIESFN